MAILRNQNAGGELQHSNIKQFSYGGKTRDTRDPAPITPEYFSLYYLSFMSQFLRSDPDPRSGYNIKEMREWRPSL